MRGDKHVVGVTGFQAGAAPSAGLAVAHCLGGLHQEVSVLAIDYNAYSTGLYSCDVFANTQLLPWSEDPETILEQLVSLREGHGLDMLVPCLAADIARLAPIAEAVRVLGVAVELPASWAVACRGKEALTRSIAANPAGFEYPRTLTYSGEEPLSDFLADLEYPIVVKGLTYGAFLSSTPAGAEAYVRKFEAMFGLPVLLQELVEGEQFSVSGVCVGDGIDGTIVKKLGLDAAGKMWIGATVDYDELLDLSIRFVQGMNWRGPFELDLACVDDRVCVLDFNPRFSSWVDALASVGTNLPLGLVADALSLTCDRAKLSTPPGWVLAKQYEDVPVDLARLYAASEDVSHNGADLYWRV